MRFGDPRTSLQSIDGRQAEPLRRTGSRRSTAACVSLLATIAAGVPALAAPHPNAATHPGPAATAGGPDAAFIERFARLALECIHKEYPGQIMHVMSGDGDVKPPRELTPAFCGCYDWHSAVHGHWLLVRLGRLHPEAPFAAEALEALGRGFTRVKNEGEVRYLQGEGRAACRGPAATPEVHSCPAFSSRLTTLEYPRSAAHADAVLPCLSFTLGSAP